MKSSWKMNKSWRKVNEKCLKSQQKCEKSHQKWISRWNSRKVKKWPVGKKATLLKVVHQNRSNDPTKSPKTRHLCGCNQIICRHNSNIEFHWPLNCAHQTPTPKICPEIDYINLCQGVAVVFLQGVLISNFLLRNPSTPNGSSEKAAKMHLCSQLLHFQIKKWSSSCWPKPEIN